MDIKRKGVAVTAMTVGEIERAAVKNAASGVGPLSREEKAAGGRIRIKQRRSCFLITHKYPGIYSASPAVLRVRVEDGGKTRRLCWRIGKSRTVTALSAAVIILLVIAGVIRIIGDACFTGAVLIILAALLFPVAFLPSREERELLYGDLCRIFHAAEEENSGERRT